MSTLSPEFIKARTDFAAWYDAKSEDEQQLIDEISDRTYFIIDEDEYDSFIDELNGYDITDASTFEDAFYGEWDGVDKESEFSEDFMDSCGYSLEPEFIAHCIDWEKVWYSALQYDFYVIEFKGNSYFFNRNY